MGGSVFAPFTVRKLSPTFVLRKGDPGKDAEKMERKQSRREKTEKGHTRTEKRDQPCGSFSYSGTGLLSIRFLFRWSSVRLSLLILNPCPVAMPLATNVWER
jgi:hypothetical protein